MRFHNTQYYADDSEYAIDNELTRIMSTKYSLFML